MPFPSYTAGELSDSSAYPFGAEISGYTIGAVSSGTYYLIPGNAKRRTLLVSMSSQSSVYLIRPYATPVGGGLQFNSSNPIALLSWDNVGPQIKSAWWVQVISPNTTIYVFETLEEEGG